MLDKKRVALVLGGGGALGLAHIGVIKVLEEHNIPIDIVVGTSMGGVVGAAYVTGVTIEQMFEFACKFKTFDLFDVNFNATGLFSGKGVMKEINKFLPDINIENTSKEFACVAVDLLSEKEVVFRTGPIRDAVRATLSIPGVFVPLQKNEMCLVDGGTLNNLPEDVAMRMGADVIISVDVLKKCTIKTAPKNIFESLMFSIILSNKEIQKLKSTHSDVSLVPDLEGLSILGFSKANALKAIAKGEEEALKYIKDIKKLIKC